MEPDAVMSKELLDQLVNNFHTRGELVVDGARCGDVLRAEFVVVKRWLLKLYVGLATLCWSHTDNNVKIRRANVDFGGARQAVASKAKRTLSEVLDMAL